MRSTVPAAAASTLVAAACALNALHEITHKHYVQTFFWALGVFVFVTFTAWLTDHGA